MQIHIEKELVNKDYTVEFSVKEVSEEFATATEKFGFPMVEFGGKFVEVDEDDVEKELFKLNTNVKKIPAEMPLTRIFKTSQYGENAEKFANAYVKEMKIRLASEINAITSKQDNFSPDDEDLVF